MARARCGRHLPRRASLWELTQRRIGLGGTAIRTIESVMPALLIATVTACSSGNSDTGDSAHPRRTGQQHGGTPASVALIDSVPFRDDMGEGGYLRRVELRSQRAADTIGGVLTAEVPVLVGDSLVTGFAYEGSAITKGFVYHADSRRLDLVALPSDMTTPYWGRPALSPDGRHVAYAAFAPNGVARVVVRGWPHGSVVTSGQPVALLATDSAVDWAKWTDADHFEVYLRGADGRWQRFRGSVSQREMSVEASDAPH